MLLLFYADNEPKSAHARDLGDCRDNKGKLAKRVFTFYRKIPMDLSVKKWTQVVRKKITNPENSVDRRKAL